MSTPQQRVQLERQELWERMTKLHTFLEKPENATIVGEAQWVLMEEQLELQAKLIHIFDCRLSLFNSPKS